MKIALTQGAYQTKSIIASAQRCINLYQEKNPEDSPFPITHYLTPGLDQLSTGTSLSNVAQVRCTFRTSTGLLYVVIGTTVYYVDPAFVFTSLGTIDSGTNPVSMQDNGLVILIADNTANLYAIDISSGAPGTFAQVTDPNIYGATRVDVLDTFFILNVPNTNEWYISLSEVNFDMLTGTAGSILTGSITDAGQGGQIATGSISAAGTGYTPGTYTSVPLTGGSGAGAIATIVVSGGDVVSSVTITTPASGYLVGDVLSAAASSIGGTGSGFTWTVATVVGTYTDGTYTAVPLTGGTGSGAQATIIVSGGFVSTVTITTPATGYVVGDVLSAANSNIGNTGTGFTWTVATVGGTAFDPLDIATKITYPDAIQSLIVMHGEIWLVGTLTTEIWYNSGAADFTFQILPGTFIEHGTIAPYSLCKQDLSVYWISQDEQGQAIVVKGAGYQAKRISNFAIENTLSTYQTVSDCIGFTYQQEGHTFVCFSFPSANTTWVYDETMGLWHQRCWTDNNGNLNRHRMNVGCNVYNKNVVGDWQNGNLYALDLDTYVDNVDGLGLNSDGSYPISRIRSWPVLIEENNRISHNSFRADMQVGTAVGTQSSNPPTVSLRWSDDRGETYNNGLAQSLGAQGQYLTNLQWRRLGMARGRVYELSWSVAANTALNGAWVTVTPAGT